MNDDELAKHIIHELNHSAAGLGSHATERLQTARTAALTQYRASQAAPAMVLTNHGSSFAHHGRDWISQHRLWLPIAALIIGLTTIAYWQTNMQNEDIEDVDASLLASDLPVNAYMDYRLSTWLESSKQ